MSFQHHTHVGLSLYNDRLILPCPPVKALTLNLCLSIFELSAPYRAEPFLLVHLLYPIVSSFEFPAPYRAELFLLHVIVPLDPIELHAVLTLRGPFELSVLYRPEPLNSNFQCHIGLSLFYMIV